MRIPDAMLQSITRLFQRMDRAYDDCARNSGFICDGCKDNCCLTRFYHHTLLEVLTIRSGLRNLTAERRKRIRDAAHDAIHQSQVLQNRQVSVRVMCPLNDAGRCVLYDRRPMICRLHGIPHMLRRPDGRTITGPGCDDYDRQCPHAREEMLDRTPLYRAMADMERQLRAHLDFNAKIKLTVAEIIIDERFDNAAMKIEE